MSYIAKINERLDNLDLGKAEGTLNIYNNRIYVQAAAWSPKFDNDTFEDKLLASVYMPRHFDEEKGAYSINRSDVLDRIRNDLYSNARSHFINCSPAKAPRRTKLWKSFEKTLSQNYHNEEFMNSLYEINEYIWSNTKTDSITAEKNDVHRKNAFQLLILMEKSYGRERETSAKARNG